MSGPWQGPGAVTPADEQRWGLRCRWCARTQPPGVASCVYCGAPLPVRRWVAHPPPGVGPRRRVRLVRGPYLGPPGYRFGHPGWGFPPVTWRNATVSDGEDDGPAPVRALRAVAILAVLTTVACLVAAAAESWRFALLLAGRTEVLAGGPVRASDALVAAGGGAALVFGAVTAVVAAPMLVRLHRAAAVRAGRMPNRTPAGLVARLVIPGWNLYGAGQVLTEISRSLRQSDRRRRSSRVTVGLWWCAWVLDGLLVLAALIMAFGRSNQIMGDTVQVHIAIDAVAAVVAGLFAAVAVSFGRSLTGRGSRRYIGWSVRPPESSARNRAAVVGGDGATGADHAGALDPLAAGAGVVGGDGDAVP